MEQPPPFDEDTFADLLMRFDMPGGRGNRPTGPGGVGGVGAGPHMPSPGPQAPVPPASPQQRPVPPGPGLRPAGLGPGAFPPPWPPPVRRRVDLTPPRDLDDTPLVMLTPLGSPVGPVDPGRVPQSEAVMRHRLDLNRVVMRNMNRRIEQQAEELRFADQKMAEVERTHQKAAGAVKLKPPKYDGSDDFLDYHEQFEAIAEANGWTEEFKGVMLLSCLEGKARATVRGMKRYRDLVERLMNRYSPESEDMSAQQLQVLMQKPDQTWEDLAEEAQLLAERGYLESGHKARERLAVQAFVNAVEDDDIRMKLRDSHAKTMDGTLAAVRQAEANVQLEKHRGGDTGKKPGKTKAVQEVQEEGEKTLSEQLSQLMGRIDQLDQRGSTGRRPERKQADRRQRFQRPRQSGKDVICYYCAGTGHFQSECPEKLKVLQDAKARLQQGNSQGQAQTPGARMTLPQNQRT